MNYTFRLIVSCVCMTSVIQLNAQQDIPKFKFQGVYINTNSSILGGSTLDLIDYDILTQNSIFRTPAEKPDFKEEYNFYLPETGIISNRTGGLCVGAEFNIRSKRPDKIKQEFRVGIFSNRNQEFSSGRSTTNVFLGQTFWDSIRSDNPQDPPIAVYRQSFQYRDFNAFYSHSQVGLDAGYIFRMFPEHKLSMYGGVGTHMGIVYDAHTVIYYEGYTWSDLSVANSTYSRKESNRTYAYEYLKNKNGYFMSISWIAGLNFRISKKDGFWGKCNLYTEIRPVSSYVNIEGYKEELSSTIMAGTGFRYVW